MTPGPRRFAMEALPRFGAAEAAAGIRAGKVSAVDLLEACLARIERLEPRIKAWVAVDAEGARRVARERDEDVRAGRPLGALHGVAVGIKDIVHARGFVTTAGAAPFFHECPASDATLVARLRDAGAIILGKTTTTEFANRDPAETRNPWNLDHTPGGSSSGSAAAVSARMVPLAIGSQTVGSTLRPAAYCGIVGLKPTHGRISTAGVIPLAWSTDTVGVFGRSVADAALALDALAGYDAADLASVAAPAPDAFAALARAGRPPALGVPRRFVERATPEVIAHIDAVAERCRQAGAAIRDVELPESFAGLHAAGERVVQAEAAAFHSERFRAHSEKYRDKFRATLAAGMTVAAIDYVGALRQCRRFRRDLEALLERVDALLLPVAPGPAPQGLDSTGDASFCAPASYAGVPSIALPSGLTGGGLPLGVQLVGRPWQEADLLLTARWLEALLAFEHVPSLDPRMED